MRILFLSQVLPYPIDAGPKKRSYYVLRYLTQQHEVTLLTFIRDTDKEADVAHLRAFCQTVQTIPMRRSRLNDLKFLGQSLFSRQPFLILRDDVLAMNIALEHLVTSQHFDVIHADQIWMARYALTARRHSPASKLIIDKHNADHLIPKRLAADSGNFFLKPILSREASLMADYELDVCRRFDYVVWVTAEDRQAVAALPEAANLSFAPSTVIPICDSPADVAPITRVPDTRTITFLGGLHWPPNAQGILWFARQVFPEIRKVMPDVTLTVIGKDPPAGLDQPGIDVTGYVADLRPYLERTAAFVVPLHAGGGMRVKILDAWSWGLPVVSTTIGAEGLNIRAGENILIADTVNAFAQAVLQVLQDADAARSLAAYGRQTVLQDYNWQTVYRAWDSVYAHLPAQSIQQQEDSHAIQG